MTRTVFVTVTCDGPRCRERMRAATVDVVAAAGWRIVDDEDLCPRCASGKCAGTVGERPSWMGVDQWSPCPCVLPFGHDGICACVHDIRIDDMIDETGDD